MPLILDGKKAAEALAAALQEKVKLWPAALTLSVIQVGARADSNAYIKAKTAFAEKIGVKVELVKFPEDISEEIVTSAVLERNNRTDIQGIIVQLPLPAHWDADVILENIIPEKDVDALTAKNVKNLLAGRAGLMPATAAGILKLLEFYGLPLSGKRALVVGRSLMVGKAIALAFLNQDATVTICHKKTENLAALAKEADILVVAAGRPALIGKDCVKAGQVVIDVGINEVPGGKLDEEIFGRKLVGDVKFDEVSPIVAAISPVPGGVGPMTVAALFSNLLDLVGNLKY